MTAAKYLLGASLMNSYHKDFQKWLRKYHKEIAGLTGIGVLIVTIIGVALSLPSCRGEETYISKRPNIKIKSVYLKTIPYQAADGSQALALKFYIPIRNDGDATAYDVEIKKRASLS
jgi:hypothetical protein